MEEKNRKPEGDRENLDEEMEGSLGVPPSGGQSERSTDRDVGIPEFGRLDDEDHMSER